MRRLDIRCAVLVTLLAAGATAQSPFGPRSGNAFLFVDPTPQANRIDVELRGPAGGAVFLLASLGFAPTPTPIGVLWITPPFVPIEVGGTSTSAMGRYGRTLLVPQLAGLAVFLQGAIATPSTIDVSNVASIRVGGQLPLWQEGFETYPIGPWQLPSGAWRHGGGNTQIDITSATAASGSKSLSQFGAIGGCWAALSSHPIDPIAQRYANDFTVEMKVRAGNEATSGCHMDGRIYVTLQRQAAWANPARNLIAVGQSGAVRILGQSVAASPLPLMTWQKVRLRYTRIDLTSARVICHVNDQPYATVTAPTLGFEDSIAWIQFWAGEGSAWFDDIAVWPGF